MNYSPPAVLLLKQYQRNCASKCRVLKCEVANVDIVSKLKCGQFLRCSPRQVWRELGWQLPLKTARFSRRTSQAAQISRRTVQCGSININSLLILDKMSNFFPRANVGCSPDCKIHSSKPALLAGSKHSRRLQGQSHYIKLLFWTKNSFF